jgi:hypothetical protein
MPGSSRTRHKRVAGSRAELNLSWMSPDAVRAAQAAIKFRKSIA